MSKIKNGEEARNKSISIRPFKIFPNFELEATKIKLTPSELISVLIVYFIERKNNKQLLNFIKNIKEKIENKNLSLLPNF